MKTEIVIEVSDANKELFHDLEPCIIGAAIKMWMFGTDPDGTIESEFEHMCQGGDTGQLWKTTMELLTQGVIVAKARYNDVNK